MLKFRPPLTFCGAKFFDDEAHSSKPDARAMSLGQPAVVAHVSSGHCQFEDCSGTATGTLRGQLRGTAWCFRVCEPCRQICLAMKVHPRELYMRADDGATPKLTYAPTKTLGGKLRHNLLLNP